MNGYVCGYEHIPGYELLYQTVINYFVGKPLEARLQSIHWNCRANGPMRSDGGRGRPAIPGCGSNMQTGGGYGAFIKFMAAPSHTFSSSFKPMNDYDYSMNTDLIHQTYFFNMMLM